MSIRKTRKGFCLNATPESCAHLRGDDESDADSEDEAEKGENDEDADGDGNEEEEEEGHGGIVMPADVLAANMAEGLGEDGESSSHGVESDASSGLEDAGSDSDNESEDPKQDDESEKPGGDLGKAAGGGASHLAKPKLYDQSPEWTQLCLIEAERNVTLVRLPELAGCGISRHPAKSFWSARYPNQATKNVSWSVYGRTPMQCLAKVLRYVIRTHMAENPHLHDMHSWKIQMQNLMDFEKQ